MAAISRCVRIFYWFFVGVCVIHAKKKDNYTPDIAKKIHIYMFYFKYLIYSEKFRSIREWQNVESIELCHRVTRARSYSHARAHIHRTKYNKTVVQNTIWFMCWLFTPRCLAAFIPPNSMIEPNTKWMCACACVCDAELFWNWCYFT